MKKTIIGKCDKSTIIYVKEAAIVGF